MSKSLKISATVIAKNEAHRIGACIGALTGLVDEIVVVDSGSTDGTDAIAARQGARVIHNDWPGYGPQKRFAEDCATHDWILNLDADEVLSPGLISEIRSLFETGDPACDGYVLNIRDCDQGQVKPDPWAHTTRAVRLYDRRKGRYALSTVHDRVHFQDASPSLEDLREPVLHYSTVSVEQAISKLNRYSTMQVADLKARGRRLGASRLRLCLEFPVAFFKSWFLRGDILRGRRGFVNAMTYAFSRFARVAKAWESELDGPG